MSLTGIFTWKKAANFIINELLGKFVGFVVGMWASKLFTHQVYERKSIKNAFGLLGRKKIIVNDTPEWLQWLFAAVIGFVVLELISYFFENKLYLKVYDLVRNQLNDKDETTDRNKDLVE